MANPRRRFERFCLRNRDKGIPNLMLYITLGSALVYLFTMVTDNDLLYQWLAFDYNLILKGQVWRLFTYALLFDSGNIVMTAVGLICYFSLGRAMENAWGTLRFNLYYLTGILLMDAYAMIIGAVMGSYVGSVVSQFVSIHYLNMSLFIGFATLYPDVRFMLFFIIPIRAWIFALIDLVLVLYYLMVLPFPLNVFPLISLANYFLFFGRDVVNVLPFSWRAKVLRWFKRKPKQPKPEPVGKTIPFPGRADAPTQKPGYTHRCTICGRTDVSNPELEFRYCSRCNGYHCYCQEHISNHEHITQQ